MIIAYQPVTVIMSEPDRFTHVESSAKLFKLYSFVVFWLFARQTQIITEFPPFTFRHVISYLYKRQEKKHQSPKLNVIEFRLGARAASIHEK